MRNVLFLLLGLQMFIILPTVAAPTCNRYLLHLEINGDPRSRPLALAKQFADLGFKAEQESSLAHWKGISSARFLKNLSAVPGSWKLLTEPISIPRGYQKVIVSVTEATRSDRAKGFRPPSFDRVTVAVRNLVQQGFIIKEINPTIGFVRGYFNAKKLDDLARLPFLADYSIN